MDIEYVACESCGKMTRDDEIWNGIRNKKLHVCIDCHDRELEEIEEENRNRCDCLMGCNYCLMTGY